MGKRIVLGVIVFFLLVIAMVIMKSKVVMENRFFQEYSMRMEKQSMGMMMGEKDDMGMMKQAMLVDTQWVWDRTVSADEKALKPKRVDKFMLWFGSDGKLSGKTDCNDFMGSYQANGDKLAYGDFVGTKKYCEGSQEEVFTKAVTDSDSYMIDKDGMLVLMMGEDGGMMYFSAAAKPVM